MTYANARTIVSLCAVTLALAVGGCGDKGGSGSTASKDSSAKPSSTSTAQGGSKAPSSSPAAATPAAPAKKEAPKSNLPVKGPWEAVKITYTKDDAKDGSPYFKMENLGGKTILVCFMDFYGYDDKGKQIAHQDLSWNGELKGGEVDETVYTKKFEGVKTWEATYHGIKFEGDNDLTMDYKRAPKDRPKGG